MEINKKINGVLALTFVFSMLSSMTAFTEPFTNSDTTNSSFVRWNAKVYAEKYANYPGNTSYANYMDSGGDCTNFVSQVLKAGGMNMQGEPNYNYNSSWYYYGTSPPYCSYSWNNVTNFMKYWANYNNDGYNKAYSFKIYSLADALSNSGYYAIYKDLYEGDVIQFKGTGGLDHSQVVHAYNSADLFMAQHGTKPDRFWCNVKLMDYLKWIDGQYTNVTVYTLRIKKAVT